MQAMTKPIRILLFTTLLTSACGGGSSPPDVVWPAAAPALPETEVNNAVQATPMTDAQAHQLLTQSTFGATRGDIQLLKGMTAEDWIDSQMQLPATYLSQSLQQGDTDRWREYVNAWWRQTLHADDQLRQRVAFALSQIFVISGESGFSQEDAGIAGYYDILLRNAFGNYRTLLEEVTLSPIMGEYLSMRGNQKPDPEKNVQADENFARELLQLFSIGLEELNIDGTPKLDESGNTIPTYDQELIENYARVFTGWQFANAGDFRWPWQKDYLSPMESYDEYHDKDAKQLLNGVTLPAGQSGQDDLTMALDSVFNHANVGPFISRLLIQHLVTSNPSPEYVRDVATVFNKNVSGERGSLGSTIKAILLHEEARMGATLYPTTFGKVKEPLLRVTSLWRAFDPGYVHEDFNYAWADNELRQLPLNSPTVFNFFRPDYRQPGELNLLDLKSPEFQIIDESAIVVITNRLLANALWLNNYNADPSTSHMTINIDYEVGLVENPEALVDHLNLLLLGGTMSDGLRDILLQLIDETSSDSRKVADAIFITASSPEAAVQR